MNILTEQFSLHFAAYSFFYPNFKDSKLPKARYV